jgi:hypothetical protein
MSKKTIRLFGQDVEIPAETEIVGPVVDFGIDDDDDDIDQKLEEWLDEADRLARLHDDYYFNPHLGYPKYGNGLDHLYPEKSPQQALDWWAKAVPIQEDEDGITFDVVSPSNGVEK